MSFQSINKIASIILAGGQGLRLHPLTLNHCKPAISYGGRYKLIDIPISNSLNSSINNILIIGQHLTKELAIHLDQTYQFDSSFSGKLKLLIPEKKANGEKIFFNGTADAVRKNLHNMSKLDAEYFLILSGDQLYNLDFQKMFNFALQTDADLTIATLPVKEEEANRLGILKVNNEASITDFYEKPQTKDILDNFKLDSGFYEKSNIKNKHPYLGSMGIYIFKKEALISLLNEDPREDFGKHLIPTQLKKGRASAFIYDGYWEDIGTIKSFYDANIDLITSNSRLKIYDENNPIYTRAQHLPGAKIKSSKIENSIICEGSIVEAHSIIRSMIGLRSIVKQNTEIIDSVILGNSSYEIPNNFSSINTFQIGENCIIKKAIIDEFVHIGKNVKLINKKNLSFYNSKNIFIRDNIIVIPAGSRIEDNFEF